jgi:hypothetical protein
MIQQRLLLEVWHIIIDSRPYKFFQSGFVDFVVFVKIYGSPFIASKACIEEFVWIWKTNALRKGQFDFVPVSIGHGDQPIVRPYRTAHPLPFLDNCGICLMKDFTASVLPRQSVSSAIYLLITSDADASPFELAFVMSFWVGTYQ